MDACQPQSNPRLLLLYRLVLRLYPGDFRVRFSQEMEQAYIDLLSDSGAGQSAWALARLWVSLLDDSIRSISREWRNSMNKRTMQIVLAVILLVAWAAFVGVSVGRQVFHWSIKDPQAWLLGEQFSSLELFLLTFALLFIPLIAFLITVLPSVHFGHTREAGELLSVRVVRLERSSAWLAAVSGLLSVLIFAVIFAARVLNW